MKILINAYACSPDMGSEPGMAWNWCINLARHCELFIITEGEFRDKIERAVANLPQSNNMHFYYNPIAEKVRKMCWNQGDWRFYWYYRKWQLKTLDIARTICRDHDIDIIHQLNMIGFREPGYLWKIKGIPFVWGPTNAKESFPTAYLKKAPFRDRLFITVKNLLNRIQLEYSSRVKSAASTASYILAASSESAISIKKYFHAEAIVINETGCSFSRTSIDRSFDGDSLHLLWVGRGIFTKQSKLAIDILNRLKDEPIVIHFVGCNAEEESNLRNYAIQRNVEKQCQWHGVVSHKEVQSFMQECQLLLFTSLAEGTPHVVLEAIANNLPVICFDTCGQGDCVDDTVGIKIPLSTPERSVADFAEAISRVYNDRKLLHGLSHNCQKRSRELSWEAKAKAMVDMYMLLKTPDPTQGC